MLPHVAHALNCPGSEIPVKSFRRKYLATRIPLATNAITIFHPLYFAFSKLIEWKLAQTMHSQQSSALLCLLYGTAQLPSNWAVPMLLLRLLLLYCDCSRATTAFENQHLHSLPEIWLELSAALRASNWRVDVKEAIDAEWGNIYGVK